MLVLFLVFIRFNTFDLQNLPIGGKGFYDTHGWLESLPAVGKTRLQVGLAQSFREFH
jgi:hypothetical protein